MKCPKCKLSISSKSKKCQYCGVKITKKVTDQIEQLPNIITKPNKIKETESLETTNEINIKPIPLKVKPITPPKEIKTKSDLEIKDKKVISTIKIIIVILLLVANTFLIIKVVTNKEEQTPNKKETKKIEHTTSNILGNWRSANNSLFAFEDNNNFFWYEYYDDLNDNYYSGTYNYKNGLDALNEMGYSEQEFTTTFGEDIKIENVYSLNLIPNYAFKAHKDVTSKDLKEKETWWFILMIRNDGTAMAYNKTLDIRYNLVKN